MEKELNYKYLISTDTFATRLERSQMQRSMFFATTAMEKGSFCIAPTATTVIPFTRCAMKDHQKGIVSERPQKSTKISL